MSESQNQRYLEYIHQSIELIERRTRDGREAFFRDVDAQDAVLWRLETLAEASGKLSVDLKQRHPGIRWRAIYGFRNIAAHGYLDLKLDLVWEIIDIHLRDLKAVVDAELERLRRSEKQG